MTGNQDDLVKHSSWGTAMFDRETHPLTAKSGSWPLIIPAVSALGREILPAKRHALSGPEPARRSRAPQAVAIVRERHVRSDEKESNPLGNAHAGQPIAPHHPCRWRLGSLARVKRLGHGTGGTQAATREVVNRVLAMENEIGSCAPLRQMLTARRLSPERRSRLLSRWVSAKAVAEFVRRGWSHNGIVCVDTWLANVPAEDSGLRARPSTAIVTGLGPESPHNYATQGDIRRH